MIYNENVDFLRTQTMSPKMLSPYAHNKMHKLIAQIVENGRNVIVNTGMWLQSHGWKLNIQDIHIGMNRQKGKGGVA